MDKKIASFDDVRQSIQPTHEGDMVVFAIMATLVTDHIDEFTWHHPNFAWFLVALDATIGCIVWCINKYS
jgi:hypothetical protein